MAQAPAYQAQDPKFKPQYCQKKIIINKAYQANGKKGFL
jgi:hypothetical protein